MEHIYFRSSIVLFGIVIGTIIGRVTRV